MGGSFYVETLTSSLEEQATSIMNDIESIGGSVAAIESGWVQNQIAEASWKYQQAIDKGEKVIVGVNDYQDAEEQVQTLFSVDRELADHQLQRLNQHREKRDAEIVRETLTALRVACEGEENLMPALLNAVRAYATLGEIIGTCLLYTSPSPRD